MAVPSRAEGSPSDRQSVTDTSLELLGAEKSYQYNYLEFFRPRLEATITDYFPADGIVQLNHNGKPENFTPARTFLREHAVISDQELDRVFTPDGKLKPFEGKSIDLSTISAFDLAEVLRERTKPVYDMVNRSLDTSLPNGFNRHGLEHIDRVLERGALYLQEQAVSDEVMKLFVLQVFGHDLGNLFSRVKHPSISMKLLEHLVPELEGNETMKHRIETGIFLHEEPILREIAEHVWQTGHYNDAGKFVIDVDDTAEAMRTTFEPEWLALIQADKFDFGRERVTEHLKGPQALAEDAHTRVNLLMETTNASKVDNAFVLELTYDQHFSEEEEARFKAITHETKYPGTSGSRRRAHVPDSMYKAHKDGLMTHSEFIEQDFWKIYEARLRIAMAATFAQDPTLREFRVEVVDPDITEVFPEKSNLRHRERIFQKGHVEEGFTHFAHAA